jgi:ribose 5-phosphate isomerase A
MPEQDDTEVLKLKRAAAERAVELVEPGMVIGLGSGTTARFAIRRIAQLVQQDRLPGLLGIPTSRLAEDEAGRLGITLTSLEEHPAIDLTIDGADEVDPALNLIKGLGGALTREKIVAMASRREVIVVDESKLSRRLATHAPLPVEVVPFGWQMLIPYLESLGAMVALRRRSGGEPYRTDQGNFILDCSFEPLQLPGLLAVRLKEHTGIVEHGLFLNLASDVFVAGPGGVRHMKRAG